MTRSATVTTGEHTLYAALELSKNSWLLAIRPGSVAEKAKIAKGINRVILATDGDFNVGVADVNALKDLVSRKRKTGITLTTLGFGGYNYNEELMEQIADVGNGNYAYIDTLKEARKVLVGELSSTLFTIAKDVKIQVEFNPAVVAEYRLIGYENRALKREDFKNDKVDAGDLGAGHTVTALYEVALVNSKGIRLDPLRYAKLKKTAEGKKDEAGFVRLRYKLPKEDSSKLIEIPLATRKIATSKIPSENIQFASAVAAYGQILKGGKYTSDYDYEEVMKLARNARGTDPHGYRAEFISLVELAKSIDTR